MHTSSAWADPDLPIAIDIKEVAFLSSLSTNTIRRLADDGLFPKGVKFGRARNSARRWNRAEVVAHLQRGIRQADAGEGPQHGG